LYICDFAEIKTEHSISQLGRNGLSARPPVAVLDNGIKRGTEAFNLSGDFMGMEDRPQMSSIPIKTD